MASNKYLDASILPPFTPATKVVQCLNGPMSALQWAFSSCVPPMARPVFSRVGGTSNASLKANTTPAMQFNYSMFHIAHHYEEGKRKFLLTDEDDTALILFEITSLRACPDDNVEGMNDILPRSEFFDPQDDEKRPLGALPLFFVRYLHGPSRKAYEDFFSDAKLIGGIIKVNAASIDEIQYAYNELQRGEVLLGKKTIRKHGKFNDSVLYPKQINKTKNPGKAPYVCAACDSVITVRPAPSCSRCKVTYYCNRECQVQHWKKGGHKKMCQINMDPMNGNNSKSSKSNKSFVFNIEDAKPPAAYMTSINHKTGNANVTGLNKEQRAELKRKGVKVSKVHSSKNVHGDKKFIVKLQPPAGLIGMSSAPWMCYDGPTRSFQAYIPTHTAGLSEVYELLQREGVKSSSPLGVSGYKGYFMAKWEGSSVRVFYDQLVSPQPW